MSALSVSVPDSVMSGLEKISSQEGISINQFVNAAIAEKISVFLSDEYAQERALRGDRESFLAVLNKAPDVEPTPPDEE
jgi:hypothetical protein